VRAEADRPNVVGEPFESRRSTRRGSVLVTLVLAAAVAAVPAHAGETSSAGSGLVERQFPAAGSLTVESVGVRTRPSPTAALIKVMRQFRSDYRLQEIFAVAVRAGSDGRAWYRISVPMRPNGIEGWIPASSVSLSPTSGLIVVRRSARTIDVYRHGRHVLHAAVAVGSPGRETPLGHFFVQARFVPDDAFLGVFALETSAYSKMTEWPGGGVVGIHGTSMPQLLGQAVSHGCVRVSNATASALRRLAPLGTPIWIID
jgi:lipoprotein-anchoring transpeptidase ErfK/SrfK